MIPDSPAYISSSYCTVPGVYVKNTLRNKTPRHVTQYLWRDFLKIGLLLMKGCCNIMLFKIKKCYFLQYIWFLISWNKYKSLSLVEVSVLIAVRSALPQITTCVHQTSGSFRVVVFRELVDKMKRKMAKCFKSKYYLAFIHLIIYYHISMMFCVQLHTPKPHFRNLML